MDLNKKIMERKIHKNSPNTPDLVKKYLKSKQVNVNALDPEAPYFGKKSPKKKFKFIKTKEKSKTSKGRFICNKLYESSSSSSDSESSSFPSSPTVSGFRSSTKKLQEEEEFNKFLHEQEQKILTSCCMTPQKKDIKIPRKRYSSMNADAIKRHFCNLITPLKVPQDERERASSDLVITSEWEMPKVRVFEVEHTLSELKLKYSSSSC